MKDRLADRRGGLGFMSWGDAGAIFAGYGRMRRGVGLKDFVEHFAHGSFRACFHNTSFARKAAAGFQMCDLVYNYAADNIAGERAGGLR